MNTLGNVVLRSKCFAPLLPWWTVAFVLYVCGYFVCMIRDHPVWKNGRVNFYSSFRWAPLGERSGVLDVDEREVRAFTEIM